MPNGSRGSAHCLGGLPGVAWVECAHKAGAWTGKPNRNRPATMKDRSGREETPSARVALRYAPPSGPLQLSNRRATSGHVLARLSARCASRHCHHERWRLGMWWVRWRRGSKRDGGGCGGWVGHAMWVEEHTHSSELSEDMVDAWDVVVVVQMGEAAYACKVCRVAPVFR